MLQGPKNLAHVGAPVLGLSADGNRFLVRTPNDVRVYADDGTLVSTIHGATDHATLSPQGFEVATTKGDVAQLWDASTGGRVHTLRGHKKRITDIEYAPDGRAVLTVSNDHTGLVWSAANGRLLHRLIGHFFPVNSGSYNANGYWIVTASQYTAGLWSASTGQLLFYIGGHTAPLTGATFSSEGDRILTGSEDGTARVYNCQVCEPLSQLEQLARRRLRRLAPR